MISSLLAGQHWIAWTFTKLQTCVSDKLISLIALISQLFAVETLHFTFHIPSEIPSLHSALALSALQRGGCESRSHRVSMKSHGLAEILLVSELGGFVDDPVGHLVWICLNLTCEIMWILNTIFMGTVWRSDDESIWIMSSWMCLVKFCHVAHLHYAMARRWPGSTPTWQSSLSRYLAWKKRLPGT